MKKILVVLTILFLSACSGKDAFNFTRALLGYTPPPEETSIGEELKLEFKRCERVDPNRNCAQIAYDTVRKVKGLEPRTVPKGVVIILEGNVDIKEKESDKQQVPENNGKPRTDMQKTSQDQEDNS